MSEKNESKVEESDTPRKKKRRQHTKSEPLVKEAEPDFLWGTGQNVPDPNLYRVADESVLLNDDRIIVGDGQYDGPDTHLHRVVDTLEETKPRLKKKSLYKLNYRRPNGLIRAEIPKPVIYTLNVNWPDLIRVIPSDVWVSIEQIFDLVSEWENVSPRKTFIRSKDSIQQGIKELIEAEVLLHS
ncbi:MAG: hypothetical protein KY428_05845 [Bacteroidetes bacterium]|nr:hypothetical protein [Bacteroidota bacterium]